VIVFTYSSIVPGAGAESLGETAKPVISMLQKDKHVAACDGSPALHASAAHSGSPALRGISHLKHLFTPLSNIPEKRIVEDSGTCPSVPDNARVLSGA
jgi:hypothetical protein